ncbi:P-loop containing nucleoside triphosphate hydrolase protein, partial [Powellomyces hirtus]
AKHTAKFSLSRTHFDNAKAETIANLEEQTREARFETMGLRPELVAAVKEVLAYDQPTQVQALCIPELLSNPEIPILCAAETGGGKTGAYLLPVINQLKQEEETLKAAVDPEESKRLDVVEAITSDGSTTSALSGTASVRKLRRPRAVIVVPSRELVAQVTATAKTICHRVRLRVVGAHAGMPASEMEEKIANAPVDLLITTPGSLNYLMRNAGFALSQTRHLVVDEADTMTDEDFGPELDTILKSATKFVNELDRPCQFVFVSATVPVTLNRMLQRHFPQVKRVTTASVHRTVPGLRQRFVRIDGSTSKQAMLIDLLKRAVIDDDRIIVFCNTRKSCELVGAHLKENGFDAHDISSNVDVKHRAKIFKEFSSPSTVAEGKEPSARKPMIVVATDIASRGVDTVNVGHVILFDFPQTAIDYLHRVGRTARNGAKGRATSIVAKKDRKLAEKIEEDVRRKQVLA